MRLRALSIDTCLPSPSLPQPPSAGSRSRISYPSPSAPRGTQGGRYTPQPEPTSGSTADVWWHGGGMAMARQNSPHGMAWNFFDMAGHGNGIAWHDKFLPKTRGMVWHGMTIFLYGNALNDMKNFFARYGIA